MSLKSLPKLWPVIVIGLLGWGIATGTQYLSGSYRTELNWSVDEPAHYVSGLMVTQYLRQGMPGNPMRFAENYYVHYPKVAIGSWPPAFYGVQGVWGLLFGSSKVSLFLLIGLLMGLGSAGIFWCSRPFAGVWAAAAMAVAYVLVPVSQWLSAMFMAEPLIAVFALGATVCFALFLEKPGIYRGLCYGVFVILTILTKGTGVALVLLPLIAILMTRRWRLLVSPGLWVAAVLVCLLGGIWTFLTLQIVSEGWADKPGVRYAVNALLDEPVYVWDNLGTLLVVLSLFGAWKAVRQTSSIGIAMLSSILGIFVFYMIPPIGLEKRYFHVVVPMALILAAMGLEAVTGMIRFRYVRELLAVAIVGGCLWRYFPVQPKPHYGFDQAAARFVGRDLGGCVALLSSNTDLEGMFISEVAMRQPVPAVYLVRSTKALARSNWSGSSYQVLYPNAAAVYDFLEQSPVNLIVTDTFPKLPRSMNKPHHALVREMLSEHPGDWEQIDSIATPPDAPVPANLELYRHRRKPCVDSPQVEVDMREKLQRNLKNRPGSAPER